MAILRLYGLEDDTRVAAFRASGPGQASVRRDEFAVGTVGGGYNQAGDSTVLVAANNRGVSPLPDDVPDDGSIWVLSPNDTGEYIKFDYSSVNRITNIFTLTGTIGSFITGWGEDSSDLVLDDNVFVSLIADDSVGTEISKTITFVSTIRLFIVARITGKKPTWLTATFPSGGLDVNITLETDNVISSPVSAESDVYVDWVRRIIWAEVSRTAIEVQEIVDIMRIRETDWAAMDEDYTGFNGHAVDAEGKLEIESGIFTGISCVLRDFRFGFEARTLAEATGTITAADPTGRSLIDSGANFGPGDFSEGAAVCNYTDGSLGTFLERVSKTELLHIALADGIDNQWEIGDSYRIYNIAACAVNGGNLISRDDSANFQNAIFTTPNTQVKNTLSVSATFQEEELIQYASFGGVVTIDVVDGYTLAQQALAGNKRYPIKSVQEAVQVADTRGLDTLSFVEDATLGAGDDVSEFILIGQNPTLTTLTVEAAALVVDCTFRAMTLTGMLDGECWIEDCTIEDLTYFAGRIDRSRINGALTLTGTALIDLIDSFSGESGDFILDVNGWRSVSIHRLSGGIKIRNFTGGAGSESITITGAGQVELEDTVVAGTVSIVGVLNLIDNSGPGCTVNVDGQATRAAIAETVWGESAEPVYIDAVYGASGTEYPQGTATNPVKTLADAHAIGARWNKKRLAINGHGIPTILTAALDWSEWLISGVTSITQDIVVLAGVNITGCRFRSVFITGLVIGTTMDMMDGVAGDLSGIAGAIYSLNCSFTGTLTFLDGGQLFVAGGGFSGQTGLLDPVILDCNNATFGAIGIDSTGVIEIRNLTGNFYIGMLLHGGDVHRAASCDGGILELAGTARFRNSGTGGSINTTTLIDPVESKDVHEMSVGELALADGSVGNWVLRNEDGSVRKTFSVTDKNGNGIIIPTLAPARRTRGV